MLSTKLCLCAVAVALPACSALQPGVPLSNAHSKPLFARGIASRTGIVTSPSVRSPAVQLTAAAAKPPEGSSVSASVVNLAKNIVGSGILALAAGVAAFSGAKIAILPALALLFLLGGISGYTYSVIGRVGDAVGADTYKDTWNKIFGEKTGFLPEFTVVFMTLCAGLGYAIIIGDTFQSVAKLAGATGVVATSNFWIILLSVTILLPLSLMRDLSSLAIGSAIGNAGTLYTMLFMSLRLADGSYAKGGKFALSIAEASRPKFASALTVGPEVFVLISMLASAFLAHYNAPKTYKELAPPADGSSKVPKFNLVCALGFGGAALLMGAVMTAGFLTFGSASQGLILNNYATADSLAFLARVGIGASIIFSFPLNFVGLREGVLGMLGLKEQANKPSVHWITTIALMCVTNGVALVLKDLGLIVALGGAILASALVYIFPALMAVYEKGGATGSLEKKFNVFLTGLGVFLAGLGAKMCLA